MARLSWTPDVFWAATMHEFTAANNGYLKMHEPAETDMSGAATRDEFEMLKKKVERANANV